MAFLGQGWSIPKKSLYTVLTILALNSPISCETDFFKHFATFFSCGMMAFPQVELGEYFDGSPVFNISLISPYQGNWYVHVAFQYSHLDGTLANRSLHYAKSGAGIAFKPKHTIIPGLGIGVGNYFIRSDANRDSIRYLLDDNESEFGGYPFFYWEISLYKQLEFQLKITWDIILSEPKYTHLPTVTAGVGWYWW